jgi:hypothetical protein
MSDIVKSFVTGAKIYFLPKLQGISSVLFYPHHKITPNCCFKIDFQAQN